MTSLSERRRHAAMLSRGISSEPIYQLTQRIVREVDLGPDLLDLGAGAGHLLRQLIGQGYAGTLTGADLQPRPESLPAAIRWIEGDLNDPLPLPDGSFSALIANEIVSALENPRAVFREFHRLLRPGGVLIVSDPNQETLRSLIALIFGGHFVAFRGDAYPKAITALLHQDWERLCAETGFAPPRFFYTGQGGLPKMPGVTWQQISFGLLRGRLFSDNLALLTYKR